MQTFSVSTFLEKKLQILIRRRHNIAASAAIRWHQDEQKIKKIN